MSYEFEDPSQIGSSTTFNEFMSDLNSFIGGIAGQIESTATAFSNQLESDLASLNAALTKSDVPLQVPTTVSGLQSGVREVIALATDSNARTAKVNELVTDFGEEVLRTVGKEVETLIQEAEAQEVITFEEGTGIPLVTPPDDATISELVPNVIKDINGFITTIARAIKNPQEFVQAQAASILNNTVKDAIDTANQQLINNSVLAGDIAAAQLLSSNVNVDNDGVLIIGDGEFEPDGPVTVAIPTEFGSVPDVAIRAFERADAIVKGKIIEAIGTAIPQAVKTRNAVAVDDELPTKAANARTIPDGLDDRIKSLENRVAKGWSNWSQSLISLDNQRKAACLPYPHNMLPDGNSIISKSAKTIPAGQYGDVNLTFDVDFEAMNGIISENYNAALKHRNFLVESLEGQRRKLQNAKEQLNKNPNSIELRDILTSVRGEIKIDLDAFTSDKDTNDFGIEAWEDASVRFSTFWGEMLKETQKVYAVEETLS